MQILSITFCHITGFLSKTSVFLLHQQRLSTDVYKVHIKLSAGQRLSLSDVMIIDLQLEKYNLAERPYIMHSLLFKSIDCILKMAMKDLVS